MTISSIIPKRLDVALLFIASLLAVLALLGAERVHAQNGVIEIAKVDGQTSGDAINANWPEIRFVLRYRNTTGERVNVYNSWQISSPDGAVWLDSHLDTLGPFSGGQSLFTAYFQNANGVFSGDGYPTPDTLGYSGAGAYSNPSSMLPAGFSDTVLAIRLSMGPASVNNGKHICIDSASRQPFDPTPPIVSNRWHWQSGTDPLWSTPEFVGSPGVYVPGNGYCFTLYQCSNMPPIITNCPAMISGSYCMPMRFDFDAMDAEWDPYTFELVSGPGSIDPATGVWTWDNIKASDIGLHTLVVRARDTGPCSSAGPSCGINVNVTAGVVDITGGFGLTSLRTGEIVQSQMTVDPADCPADAWTVAQALGGPATYSISPEGLLQFTTANYGVYQLDVIAHASSAADTSSHIYVVHGGPGCCQGQRGNLDLQGITDVSDLSRLVNYLTLPYIILPCYDAADMNGSGLVDLSDLSALINYLTSQNGSLPGCP